MTDAPEALGASTLFDVTTVPLKLGHISSLASRFTLPPFTQLDARAGWWQDRKRQWIDLGLRSADGRDARTFAKAAGSDEVSQKILALTDGQSIFDPVLAEMVYRWFVPNGGTVLDPCAGGSVRGIVAATLGRRYVGIDLSRKQVEANQLQDIDFVARNIYTHEIRPQWFVGDSAAVLADGEDEDGHPVLGNVKADAILSCPPYHDLEVYSDDPRDLSNMPWGKFKDLYRAMIEESVKRLANDRFAVFVVGEIRGPDGFYRNFVPLTIEAFEDAGARYYNEAFLVSPAGTLPLRAAKQFVVSRKLGRTHQTVLVFVKGDPKAAARACDPEALAAYVSEHPTDTDPSEPEGDADLSGIGHG